MQFLIFLLSTIGLSLIITISYIFNPIRERADRINKKLGRLLKCNQCVGFWSALLIQFIILVNQRAGFIFYWSDLYYIIYGFIGSFICFVVYLLIKPLIDKHG